jgi:hypothetical protein
VPDVSFVVSELSLIVAGMFAAFTDPFLSVVTGGGVATPFCFVRASIAFRFES